MHGNLLIFNKDMVLCSIAIGCNRDQFSKTRGKPEKPTVNNSSHDKVMKIDYILTNMSSKGVCEHMHFKKKFKALGPPNFTFHSIPLFKLVT